jgi:DNA-binding cell septation regulator SpoVG
MEIVCMSIDGNGGDMKGAMTPQLKTRIRVYPAAGKGKADLLGFADLTIGGAFVIKSIRIMQLNPERAGGEVGDPFIAFPSRKVASEGEDRYFDVAHPITSEAYRAAADLILAKYQESASRDV